MAEKWEKLKEKKPDKIWLIRNKDDKITEWYDAKVMDKWLKEVEKLIASFIKESASSG